MRAWIAGLAAGCVLLAAAVPLQAQDNEQTVVIGATLLGLHSYDTTDEVRNAFFLLIPDVAGMGHLFLEWYPAGNFGIGGRYLVIGATEQVTSGGPTLETSIELTSFLLTLQYIPWISSDRYARMGLLLGAGGATYEVTQTLGAASANASTTGPATLIQAHIDWGGEDFGARLGFGHLSTKLEPLDIGTPPDLQADASGNHFFLDLRWAFQ